MVCPLDRCHGGGTVKLFEVLHRIEAMTGSGDGDPDLDPGRGYDLKMGGWVENGEAVVYAGRMRGFYGTMYYQMLHPVKGLVWIPTRSVIEMGEEG